MNSNESKSFDYKKILKIAFIVIVSIVAINIAVFVVKLLKTGENFVKDTIKTVLGPFILLGDETQKYCDKQKNCNADYTSKKSCEDEATCYWDEINLCQNATKRNEGDTDTGRCIGFVLLGIVTFFGLFGLMAVFYKYMARNNNVDPALKDFSRIIDGVDIYIIKSDLSKEMDANLEKDLEEFNKKQREGGKTEITSKEGKLLYGQMKLRKRLAETCDKITSEANVLTSEQQAQWHTEFYNTHTQAFDKINEERGEKAKEGKIDEGENEALDKAAEEFKPIEFGK
jgi:hypothetical protein